MIVSAHSDFKVLRYKRDYYESDFITKVEGGIVNIKISEYTDHLAVHSKFD